MFRPQAQRDTGRTASDIEPPDRTLGGAVVGHVPEPLGPEGHPLAEQFVDHF